MIRPILISALLALPAAAQVTLEEADSVMSDRDAEMEAFRVRLNDPDPDKALAILRLLIVKGDTDQRRLAVRHGLQSTDRAIRATTLRAILDAEPTLTMHFDPVSEEAGTYYTRAIRQAGGVIDEDQSSAVQRKIDGYKEDEACWTVRGGCFARIQGDVVSLLFGGSWGNYTLNGTGQLKGRQEVGQSLAAGTVDLSE